MAWRELDALDICGIERGHANGSLCVQGIDERAVGNVVTECVETKFACPELDVRRAKQAARGVDDADGLEWRRMGHDRLPHTKRLQHVHRAFQERRGPRIERLLAVRQGGRESRGGRPDQRHARAAMGERKRGSKTGRAGPDNGNVDVHRFRQDLLASRLRARSHLEASPHAADL